MTFRQIKFNFVISFSLIRKDCKSFSKNLESSIDLHLMQTFGWINFLLYSVVVIPCRETLIGRSIIDPQISKLSTLDI